MSADDYKALRPEEFEACAAAFSEYREAVMQNDWERTRQQALCSVAPFSSKRITAHELMPFAWDNKPREKAKAPTVSKEDDMKALAALMKQIRKN